MRKFITTAVFLLGWVVSPAQQPVSAADRAIVFRNVSIIPMDRQGVVEGQTVVVRDGRITDMGPSRRIRYSADALVIDAQGKYLIPGLAEMHAHVPPSENISAMEDVLMLFAVNGITTIRGMLGHPQHLELRERLNQGEIIGPRFYTTGPSFNGMSVKTPEDGAAMVRRQKEAGYDYLKLHPGLTRPKFDAIAAAAKEVGIPFAGHVSYGVGVWRAIEAGYSSIDHLDGFVEGLIPGVERIPEQEAGLFAMYIADRADRNQIPKLMKALKDNKIWVVPTQALAERWFHPDFKPEDFLRDPHHVYMPKATREQWMNTKRNLLDNPKYDAGRIREFISLRRDLIRECQKAGVGLLLGCDAPQVFNVPGFSTHHELEYLVLSGLTPWQALATGTRNVADYLGKKDSGIIAKGAVSDLVLLNANPLDDIRNTANIAGVMIGNQWMDKSFIDAQLKVLRKE